MSLRIVVLGPVRDGKQLGLEIDSASAGALLKENNLSKAGWRVSLTRYSGALYDATVIVRKREWDSSEEETSRQRGEDVAWEILLSLVPNGILLRLPTPLEVGGY